MRGFREGGKLIGLNVGLALVDLPSWEALLTVNLYIFGEVVDRMVLGRGVTP